MPMSRPPRRPAARGPSGRPGYTGLNSTPRPQRTHAPSAAPPPTASSPPQGKRSAHELLAVTCAEAACRVMTPAQVDLGPHVLVGGLPAGLIDVDHRARDVEERDHFRAVLGHGEGVHFPGRLVDEAALLRHPVVLEVFPPSLDHIADHAHRVAMPRQHARAAHSQEVAPAATDGVEEPRAKPYVRRLRHPYALVIGD